MLKTINWSELTRVEQQRAIERPANEQQTTIYTQTTAIIEAVRTHGDAALIDFTQRFDKVKLEQLKLSSAAIAAAQQQVDANFLKAMEYAMHNIRVYHQAQLPQTLALTTVPGVHCERQARPIPRVGLYVPGGSAPLISTVMMLAIPALLAGCPLRILCTPPTPTGEIDPHVVVTAAACGIQDIYKVGGAQAIAAMAYGTETIPKVDKIFGPGNAWVTQAKVLVAQDPKGASLDLPAGPSEVMIIADKSANPAFIAADLLSQAEHGVDSHVLLISTCEHLLSAVNRAVERQLAVLKRRAIAKQALEKAVFIKVEDIATAITISNEYAPEHLILNIIDAEHYVADIQCAGAVFLGPWTPEVVGDYVTGSNHVLPTYGYGRSYSGLSLKDFLTFISFQTVTEEGLKALAPAAMQLAALEGLTAHEYALKVRLAK